MAEHPSFSMTDSKNGNTLFVGIPNNSDNMGGNLHFGDPACFAPRIFNYIVNRHCIRSVLDVGAGLGHLAYYLHNTFNLPVIGLEGLRYNVENAIYPLILHDLRTSPYQGTAVDLVTCLETVEHIEERYIDNLLATLTSGKLLLMTHATPNRNAAFHVNEQSSEYWINKIQARGFILLKQDTSIIRAIAKKEDHSISWFAESGLLFGRLPGKMG